MSQQITILVFVDVKAALNSNSLHNNIYLIDNLRTEGSTGVGTPDLTSAVNGSHLCDRSQAYQPVINWLPYGISSIETVLPKGYMYNAVRKQDKEIIKSVQKSISNNKSNKKSNEEISINMGVKIMIKDSRGINQDTEMKLLDDKGNLFDSRSNNLVNIENDLINQLPVKINDITGEAVDKGILYPAQYGSNFAWYWSATASTYKRGTYSYTMHFTLYDIFEYLPENNKIILTPIHLTHEAKIKVSSKPMKNGFSRGGLWYLPVY